MPNFVRKADVKFMTRMGDAHIRGIPLTPSEEEEFVAAHERMKEAAKFMFRLTEKELTYEGE